MKIFFSRSRPFLAHKKIVWAWSTERVFCIHDCLPSLNETFSCPTNPLQDCFSYVHVLDINEKCSSVSFSWIGHELLFWSHSYASFQYDHSMYCPAFLKHLTVPTSELFSRLFLNFLKLCWKKKNYVQNYNVKMPFLTVKSVQLAILRHSYARSSASGICGLI